MPGPPPRPRAGDAISVKAPATIPEPPAALAKPAPESVADLKAIQEQTKAVVKNVMPATVGLELIMGDGKSQGSGVIVTKDGLILTAGHVAAEPDKDCVIIFPDGKRAKGRTLGINRTADSGMIQITDKGDYPFVEQSKSSDTKVGQWVVALGHPGGYKKGRPPVVRLGRLNRAGANWLTSDCTLVGGDSGGPLFDMKGRLIGIHSQIDPAITKNVHVGLDAFTRDWDKLAKSKNVGAPNLIWLGVRPDEDAKTCKLGDVTKDSPADKAGFKSGDVITKFDGKEVKSYDDMLGLLFDKKPGDEVEIDLTRGTEKMSLKVKLAKRAG